jgi:hypothetical protein
MKNTTAIILICILIGLTNFQCSKKNTSDVIATRSFYMGTTPWPADLTVSEVDKTYQFINNHCDIVSHHFDEGIPYDEAYYNTVMPNNLLENVTSRKNKTAPDTKVFLSVAALGINRISKAPYYNNASTSATIKNFWEQLAFDDARVVTAYVNYVSWLIEKFKPIYVNYAVESNGQLWNDADFNKYKTFLSLVYPKLKTLYPNISFFNSFIVDESTKGFSFANQLIDYTDFVGLSAYPYTGVSSSANGNTNPQNFPSNYFEKFINLAPNKPLAFAETGYIAQDLVIPAFSLNKQGNAEWQRDYLELVLKLCNEKKAKLFIWFCPKDYDALIITFQNQAGATPYILNLLKLWRDTGLIDENGTERPSYNSWLTWMAKIKN